MSNLKYTFYEMLKYSRVRGAIFVGTGNDSSLVKEALPPVKCNHSSHSDLESFDINNIDDLMDNIYKGDLYYSLGNNRITRILVDVDDMILGYDEVDCRPRWMNSAESKYCFMVQNKELNWELNPNFVPADWSMIGTKYDTQ